jgi:putative flippase GtrA
MMNTYEIGFISRYMSGGVINTAVGFIVIFSAMALDFSPMVSNIAGYVVGFILGFVISKKFVFRSEGHLVIESIRYLVVFIVSFLLNLLVLSLAINYFNIHVMVSQVVAAISYTLLMYTLTRFFVFRAASVPS